MPRFIDHTGAVFGRLRAVAATKIEGRKETYWECLCLCGTTKLVMAQNLRDGRIRSCGCLLKESTSKRRTKHKQSRVGLDRKPSSEYKAWCAMRDRCNRVNHVGYKDYGGRGIRVDPTWEASFEAFYAYIGPKPTPAHTLDRVDVNGHYEPGNVRWATRKEQAANTRRSRA